MRDMHQGLARATRNCWHPFKNSAYSMITGTYFKLSRIFTSRDLSGICLAELFLNLDGRLLQPVRMEPVIVRLQRQIPYMPEARAAAIAIADWQRIDL